MEREREREEGVGVTCIVASVNISAGAHECGHNVRRPDSSVQWRAPVVVLGVQRGTCTVIHD